MLYPSTRHEGTETDCHCPQAVPIKKFIEEAGDPPEPVVDGLLTPGIAVLIGAPGCGKTHLANELARAVGRGESAFDRFRTKKGAVLIIEEEHHEGDLSERYERAGMEDAEIFILHAENARLDVPSWVDWIAREVERTHSILCILDPFADLHEKDESSNTEMKEVTNGLKELKQRCPGTAFLVIHHPTKGASKEGVEPEMSDGRGAGRLMGMADAVYSMACKDRSPQALKISFRCRKRRDGPAIEPQTLSLKFTEQGAAWAVDAAPSEEPDTKLRERIEKKLREARERGQLFPNRTALKSAVGGNSTQTGKVIGQMIDAKRIIEDKKKKVIDLADDAPAGLAAKDGPAANNDQEQ
ncbi:AAA family ATPase [Melittangium boletus]|uniref:AAA+ ATPase domain-containing protein n=1 Tax=Melittangium boletus DSM 14713 TaxID=1294270 RepID=A0A250IP00_9BACT|nr:AAA family ATPase [Melittangium boletus]ATB32666.1 hypothetical protein MEBOL_006155 [Melittangium boletus DSM 14713]